MKLTKKTSKVKLKSPKEEDSKKLYFGKDTHNAIITYQSIDDRQEKDKIYIEHIRPSFNKLVENLIFIHSFATDPAAFQILKNDCISFLFETLEKFDKEKGSKAFSYFNVCAKNFLIIQSNKKRKNSNRHVSIDDFVNLKKSDKTQIEEYSYIPSPEYDILYKEDKEDLFKLFESIKNKCKNDNEKKCIIAIGTLFDNQDDLEFYNKRAIFVYLREISGLNPKQLSVSMSNIRKYYKDLTGSNENFSFLFNRER